MFWLMSSVLWLCSAVFIGVQAQMLSALATLPVQWQPVEAWSWQGHTVQSQRFISDKSAVELTQLLPKLLNQDMTALALSSAWVMSFFKQERHFIFLLSAHSQGTSGWLSSLDLTESESEVPIVFRGLYEQSWSMHAQGRSPLYLVLRPRAPLAHSWSELQKRLGAQGWSGAQELCAVSLPCEWQQTGQRLVAWQDPKQGLWHLLWWRS